MSSCSSGSDLHCRTSLRHLVWCEKSLANSDVRFLCTQLSMSRGSECRYLKDGLSKLLQKHWQNAVSGSSQRYLGVPLPYHHKHAPLNTSSARIEVAKVTSSCRVLKERAVGQLPSTGHCVHIYVSKRMDIDRLLRGGSLSRLRMSSSMLKNFQVLASVVLAMK